MECTTQEQRGSQISELNSFFLPPPFCQFVLLLFLIFASSHFPIHPTILTSCHSCRHSGKVALKGPSNTENAEKGHWSLNCHPVPSCVKERITRISRQGQMQYYHWGLGQHLQWVGSVSVAELKKEWLISNQPEGWTTFLKSNNHLGKHFASGTCSY